MTEVTDTLSAAKAMVEHIHAPAFTKEGIPVEVTHDERVARATEALAYAALAIAEDLRVLNDWRRVVDD